MSAAELAEAWVASAEAQLAAARGVDAAALLAATESRAAVQADLLDLLPRLDDPERRTLAPAAARIRGLDLRIHACGHTVMQALAHLVPAAAPSTYTRRARIKGTP